MNLFHFLKKKTFVNVSVDCSIHDFDLALADVHVNRVIDHVKKRFSGEKNVWKFAKFT